MLQETEATLLAEDMKSKLQAAGWTNIRLTTLRELAKVNLERALQLVMHVFVNKSSNELFLMEDTFCEKVRHFLNFSDYHCNYFVRGMGLKRLDMPLLILEE